MNKLIVAILLYGILIATLMWFPPFYTNDLLLNNIIYSSLSFIATLGGIAAIKSLGTKGSRAKALLFMVCGTGSWFVADFLWGAETFIRGEAAYPAIADFVYLFGFIAFLLGLIQEIRLAQFCFNHINKVFLGLLLLVSLIAIGGYAYYLVYLAYSPDASLLENFVTMGYGTGDIILILLSSFLILLMWEYRGGKIARIWVFLLLGFVGAIIGDSLYAYFTADYEANVNPITNIINTFYYGGYILIATYFFKLHQFIHEVQMKILPKK